MFYSLRQADNSLVLFHPCLNECNAEQQDTVKHYRILAKWYFYKLEHPFNFILFILVKKSNKIVIRLGTSIKCFYTNLIGMIFNFLKSVHLY